VDCWTDWQEAGDTSFPLIPKTMRICPREGRPDVEPPADKSLGLTMATALLVAEPAQRECWPSWPGTLDLGIVALAWLVLVRLVGHTRGLPKPREPVR
jgi:hypothetical protein